MTSFNDNLEKRKTKTGVGVFAKVDIPKDTIIYEFKGDVLTGKDLPKDITPANDYYLQIGIDKYLGPSGDLDDFFNHSCVCNCGFIIVGNRALLMAIQFISAGTQITFDYSTTSTETKDSWQMNCNCGDYNCRKVISGYSYLDAATKEKYEALNIVPKYVKENS